MLEAERVKSIIGRLIGCLLITAVYVGFIIFTSLNEHSGVPIIQTLVRYGDFFISLLFFFVAIISYRLSNNPIATEDKRLWWLSLSSISFSLVFARQISAWLINLLLGFVNPDPWTGVLLAISPYSWIVFGIVILMTFTLFNVLIKVRGGTSALLVVLLLFLVVKGGTAYSTFQVNRQEEHSKQEIINQSPTFACLQKTDSESWKHCINSTVTSEKEYQDCLASYDYLPFIKYRDAHEDTCRIALAINERQPDKCGTIDRNLQEKCATAIISSLSPSDTGALCDKFSTSEYDYLPGHGTYYRNNCFKKLLQLLPVEEQKNRVCVFISAEDIAKGLVSDGKIFQQACPTQYTAVFMRSTDTPYVENVMATPTQNGVEIRWSTQVPSNTLVEYGLTEEYGKKITNPEFQNGAHSAFISALLPGTLYHYRVTACTQSPNQICVPSPDETFTTGVNR